MRYYLIDDSEDIVVDLIRTTKVNNDYYMFEFSHIEDGKRGAYKTCHIRQMASKYYLSVDGVQWKKLPKVRVPLTLVNVNRVFKLYRGYRPSGLGQSDSGALITQMPGKVVKIKVKEGDKVEKNQTVLIIEAMKMENEIKTSVEGIIKKIHVSEGQALDSGVLMMEIV